MQVALRPMTSADFQAMIPSHFISGGAGGRQVVQVDKGAAPHQDTVTVTVQKAVPDMPMLPPAPTELGTVTETITKSTFTETVMTRVTDNRLLEPLISEVNTVYCFTAPILFHKRTHPHFCSISLTRALPPSQLVLRGGARAVLAG